MKKNSAYFQSSLELCVFFYSSLFLTQLQAYLPSRASLRLSAQYFLIFLVFTSSLEGTEGNMQAKKTVLIIGGAGFIGSQVNKMLHKGGYQTIILDNLSTGNRDNIKEGILVEGDFGDRELLDQVFTNYSIDAVMHFAAFIDVGESVSNPLRYYRNNVVNTITLLEAMRDHQIKVLIFSSSAAVYGCPENTPLIGIKEDCDCLPINPYGETKLMVEKILRDCGHAYGIKYCCLRYFNAAGGDPDGEIKRQLAPSNLIPIVLDKIKKQKPLTIFGTDYPTPDGTCIRDYIHIFDLGIAHIKAMEKLLDGGNSAIYNLGNGAGFSVREVISSAEKITGCQVNIIEGERRLGDPSIVIADSTKAREELDWKPEYPSLESIINDAWKALN